MSDNDSPLILKLQCLVNNKATNLSIFQNKIEFNYYYDVVIIYIKEIISIRKINKTIEISNCNNTYVINISESQLITTTYIICSTLWKSCIYHELELMELKDTNIDERNITSLYERARSKDKVLEINDIYQLNSTFNCKIDQYYFKCRCTIKNASLKLYSEGMIYVTQDLIYFMSHANGKLYNICIPFYSIGDVDLETGAETRIILKSKYSNFILAGERKQMIAVYAHCLDKTEISPDSSNNEYNLINNNYKLSNDSYYSFSNIKKDFFYVTQDSMIFIRSQKLYDHIKGDFPDNQRALLWQLLSHSFYQKNLMEQNNYYKQSLEKSKNLDPNILDMIEKDLYRSLPNNPKFQDELMINSLRNVLLAYAAHNERVGYCQSMNIICAALLLYMDDVSAFYTMIAICDRIMAQCYSEKVSGTVIHINTFSKLLKNELPHIHEKLKKIKVPIKVIAISWFMCLFIDCFDDNIYLKILDLFFLKGPLILHSTAIALLSLMEEEIMQSNDVFKITSLIKGETVFPLDNLIEQIHKFPLHEFEYYYTSETMKYIQSLKC